MKLPTKINRKEILIFILSSGIDFCNFGSNFRASIKSGEKKTAPPTPEDIVIVAITIQRGSRYQYSNESSINSFLDEVKSNLKV